MLPDLEGLLGHLVDGDVEFVVIGGIAVAAHRTVRATEDVDLVPDPRGDNLDRLVDALRSLDESGALIRARTTSGDRRRPVTRARGSVRAPSR